MKVYMVMEMVSEEYGHYDVVGVYASEEGAQAYIDAQEDGAEEIDVWYQEEPIRRYEIVVREVQP